MFFQESRTLFRQVICPSGMPAKIFEKKSPPWAKHILIHYKNKFCVSTYFTKLNYLDGLVCFPEFIIGYSKIPLGLDCVACRYLEICLCRFDVYGGYFIYLVLHLILTKSGLIYLNPACGFHLFESSKFKEKGLK